MSSDKAPLRLFNHVKVEHMVAGAGAGILATLALHPLDLIKVRFQVNEGQTAVTTSRPQYKGIQNALSVIFKEGGVRGLYQGVTPNIVGGGAAWGLYFMFYNTVKHHIMERHTARHLTTIQELNAAACAGVMTLVLTNPIWVVKTRLCLQYEAIPSKRLPKTDPLHYRGMLDCLVKTYKKEGIRGWYKGFAPGLIGVSHGAIQFMVYEEIKKKFNSYKGQPLESKLGTVEYLASAATSKVIAASITYPYQVVRARLQDQHRSYTGMIDCIVRTWRYEGAKGFYKGLGPALLRVTPACCITFVVYEKVHVILLHKSEQRRNLNSTSANAKAE